MHKENFIYLNLIKSLIILQSIKYILSEISLDRIIRLGDSGFQYSHFNFKSNGDMIIDSTSYPTTNERRFFGLKNNGRFYFRDTDNKETGFYSMYASHTFGRIEGESLIIKLKSSNSNFNGRELICGISKNNGSDFYFEIYNLKNKNMSIYKNSAIFGNIFSDSFTFIKRSNEESNLDYVISYIEYSSVYTLKTKIINFSFQNINGFNILEEDSFEVSHERIVSCFFTNNSVYICFFLSTTNNLRIRTYSPDYSISERAIIHTPSSFDSNTFFKGIHLKGEIGFFIYFKENTCTYPTFSLLQYNNESKEMESYNNLNNIDVNKTTFNIYYLLNDIIKLNDFQICYISTDSYRNNLLIVIFNLYNGDTLMNIRYYSINLWDNNQLKIYQNIKASLYKNFISVVFSNCPQNLCILSSHEHYSSLVIFNYPNSTDSSLDIIPLLYSLNKKLENDFSFNFEESLTIENNLFGLVYKGTRIMSIPEGIYLIKTTNGNIIEEQSVIYKNENVSLSFDSHDIYPENNYIIEYAYVLEEPDYNNMPNIEYIDESYGNDIRSEENYYKYYEYIGKSSYFELIISEDLKTDCNDDICCLCKNDNTCVTCTYGAIFNNGGDEKICNHLSIMPATIPTNIPTTIETTIPTTIPDTIQTTIPIRIPSTNIKNPETNILTTMITEKSDLNQDCLEENILSGNCNGKMTNEQIGEVYNIIKEKISPDVNELIETENVKIQLTSLEEQKINNNPNVSSIDLGICEERLKLKENISENDSLIILKMDIKSDDLSTTYVQYEIYNPITKDSVSLEVCDDLQISVNVPVSLCENTKSIYTSLSQSGYNLFDLSDSFYNDICSVYTTENGTDLTLADRKHLIYDNNGNISMCQDGCTFQSFNFTLQKAKCDCLVQKEKTITDPSKINFEKKELVDNFYSTLANSNFLVLKCFKLVFSKQGQANNKGSYLMSGITFLFIISLFVYAINGNKKLNVFIQSILKLKLNYIAKNGKNPKIQKSNKTMNKFEANKENKEKGDKKQNKAKKEKKVKKENKDKNVKKDNKTLSDLNEKLNEEKKEKILSLRKEIKPMKKTIIKHSKFKNQNKFVPPKRNILLSTNNMSTRKSLDDILTFAYNSPTKSKNKINYLEVNYKVKNLKKENDKEMNKKICKRIDKIESIKINKESCSNLKAEKNEDIYNIRDSKIYFDKYNINNLNDEELNNLDYEIAIILDKRTYFQYYYSLLKKKQLLLFAFYPSNDYNLLPVKISLLLLSFSLYFTINGFFFSDETMNKINEDKGKYNFLYQIPQILYSTMISAIINMILKRLSLSEKQIISIKSEKDFLIARKKSKKIKKCLLIKLSIFFILSFILMAFFRYFISCFCAVYKNTQEILIEDTLISFALSMIYPFGLNLLPGMLRLPALKSAKKNKNCLYKASIFLALT